MGIYCLKHTMVLGGLCARHIVAYHSAMLCTRGRVRSHACGMAGVQRGGHEQNGELSVESVESVESVSGTGKPTSSKAASRWVWSLVVIMQQLRVNYIIRSRR